MHPDYVKAIVQCTTQQGVHMIANPTLSCWFCTNDGMLQYQNLRYPVFADTIFSNTYSNWNCKCAQVFASDFGWVHNPMKTKSKAHETLSLMFQHDGVPSFMVMDGLKEQTLGRIC